MESTGGNASAPVTICILNKNFIGRNERLWAVLMHLHSSVPHMSTCPRPPSESPFSHPAPGITKTCPHRRTLLTSFSIYRGPRLQVTTSCISSETLGHFVHSAVQHLGWLHGVPKYFVTCNKGHLTLSLPFASNCQHAHIRYFVKFLVQYALAWQHPQQYHTHNHPGLNESGARSLASL